MDELLNTAPCGFITFRDDGTLAAVNATMLEILGYERDELTGRSVEAILTVGSRIFFQTHLFPLVRLHGRAEEIFLILRSRTDEAVGVLANVVRRERDGGAVNDCVIVRVRERQKYEDELLRARRVADQARAEAEARSQELQVANAQLEDQAVELEAQQEQLREQTLDLETAGEELRAINDQLHERTEELERLRMVADEANRAKSTFLAVMSHELRTPLNAIGGYVQLMEMGIEGPITEGQRKSLERIDRSQRHLLRLINDVLNLARIEAGRVDYEIDDLPLAEVLAAVTPMVEPQVGERGLSLGTEVPAELMVRVDREKLQQVLLNLLSNAIKFTPEGGSIRIDAERAADLPDVVLLRVSDTGIGIPPEKLGTVFEPFVQVETGPSSRSEGTGLGLAISRDLARGMGGDIHLTSEVGRGTTFTVTLPRAG